MKRCSTFFVLLIGLVFLSAGPAAALTDITLPAPEPATMVLLGTGLIGIAGVGRRVGRKAAIGE